MQKSVVVVFGGVSNENEISVITGTMTANVLKKGGYNVIPVYIAQTGTIFSDASLADITAFKADGYVSAPKAIIADGGVYTLKKNGKFKKYFKADVAVNCCHGGSGENGALSGLFEMAQIPFASAGVFESSVFMDKYLTKLILKGLGVDTLPYAYIKDLEKLESRKDLPEFPVIVKPVTLGSSIGVERANDFGELRSALECAFAYDGAVIAEKYISDRREINCAAYFADGRVVVSECEEAMSGGDILSFEDKYQGGGKRVMPADIPPNMARLIRETTEKVYSSLNMRGIVRFDFILDGDRVYLSEVNTVPGSLSYYLLSGGFSDFIKVLDGVLEQASADFKKAQGKKLIKTGILKNISAQSIKGGSK